MEITDINSFLSYYKKIRKRTLRVIACIPPEKMEWSPKPEKMTLGDIIRHLAAIERYMYAETIRGNKSKYPGYQKEVAASYPTSVDFMNALHEESLEIFGKMTPEQLQQKCLTPAKTPITVWKWLRAMVEHEVHHRGHIYTYLGLLGIKTPPIFGLTSEEVLDRSEPQRYIK
ncbi:MAG: DinB family protein [Candidatus Hodarchaeota archaeon]